MRLQVVETAISAGGDELKWDVCGEVNFDGYGWKVLRSWWL